ncbi:MAG: MFS transporter, partial [Myxococcota bacterium]
MTDDPPMWTRPFALLTAGHFLQAVAGSALILLPVYLDHLGADRTAVGVVMAASALGGLAVRPLVAWTLDRVGRRPTLFAGTAVLTAGMAALGLVDRVGPFVVGVHALIGAGEAALFTGYFTLAADLVPERRRTEGLALFGISGLVPLVINPIAGQLAIAGADFRWFFPALGGLVALSSVTLAPLPETAPGTARPPPSARAVLDALRHRALWPVWLATVVFAGLVALFMAFVTVAAADRGVPDPGVVWLTYAIGAVTVRLVGRGVPDRVG